MVPRSKTPKRTGKARSGKARSGKRRDIAVPWLTPHDLPVAWDWERLFGRGGPVEVEFGTGKGGYLVQAAPARPESNFLGVDYAGRYLRLAGQRLTRLGVGNVALFYGTHEMILCELPPNSVDVFHAYFPDPWHKDRHAKRRFLRPEMLQWVHAALKPGGELRLRTDVPSYFEQMLATLDEFRAGFDTGQPLEYADEPPAPDWMPTNFERKFLEDGLPCHAVAAVKRQPAAAE